MGQVWSKADFDGIDAAGFEGGRGSVLAVTGQNPGPDDVLGTEDDILAPLNAQLVAVSIDQTPGPDCRDPMDRVRNFYSFHPGGANFLMGDGSVRFVEQGMPGPLYQALSTIAGGEDLSDGE